MKSTSTLYKSIFGGIHSYEVKANISGTDYDKTTLVSMRSNIDAFSDDGPTLGLAVSGELSLSLYVESSAIPRMATIRPYYRVINSTRQSEWIAMGVYYVDTREADTTNGLVELACFDSMLKAEVKYPSTTHAWPYSDINVVREIASFIGVSVDSRTTSLMTAGFMIPLAPQMTMREYLAYIAAMYGGSFIITEANTLLLVVLWGQKTTADLPLGSGISIKASPAFPACTGVRFIVNSTATEVTEVFAGDETGYVYEMECPFATQEMANWLLNKLRGFVYRPFQAEKTTADPALEIGDTISIPDGLGGTFLSCVWSRDLNLGSGIRPTLAAPGELEIDHEYSHESSMVRTFKRTQREVQAKIELLDNQITLAVEDIDNKVDKGTVSSEISLERGLVKIQGNRIQIDSTNFSVSTDGTITANAGSIGGWNITNQMLQKLGDVYGFTLDPINQKIDIHSRTIGTQINGSTIEFYEAVDGEKTSTVGTISCQVGQTNDIRITLDTSSDFRINDGSDFIFSAGNNLGSPMVHCNADTVVQRHNFEVFNGNSRLDGDVTITGELIVEDYVNFYDAMECWNLKVRGSLTTLGSKNRAIETKHFGTRCLGAYETAAPYFGDIGQGTTDENGECIVPIEAIFSETVDLDTEYQVFLQKEGPGDIWVQEKAKDHFTVKGTPGLKFAWELKAKQIDHGGKRLEEYKPKEKPEAHK